MWKEPVVVAPAPAPGEGGDVDELEQDEQAVPSEEEQFAQARRRMGIAGLRPRNSREDDAGLDHEAIQREYWAA